MMDDDTKLRGAQHDVQEKTRKTNFLQSDKRQRQTIRLRLG